MKYIETTNSEPLEKLLIDEISSKLERNIPVLFLVSGGSTAKIAVHICDQLNKKFAGKTGGLKWLMTFTLADERYGEFGHNNSNWQFLLDSGFSPTNFSTVPILKKTAGAAETLEEAVSSFNSFLSDAVTRAENKKLYIVGLFGIGEDGHTAGILPHSPAAKLGASQRETSTETWATGFKSALFSRITIAPAFFQHIDLATAWAGGSSKKTALEALFTEGSPEEIPGRYLSLPKKTIIFTDQHLTSGE